MSGFSRTAPVPPSIRFGGIDTPMGKVQVAVSPRGVCRVSFRSRTEIGFLRDLAGRGIGPVEPGGEEVRAVLAQIREYFRGERKRFTCRIDLAGRTDFEKAVLSCTRKVGFGRLVSYGDLAGRIDRPRAMRAVGNALGRNPVPILIPCHRVIAGGGRLGGFTGGTSFKRFLLRHEGHAAGRNGSWNSLHDRNG